MSRLGLAALVATSLSCGERRLPAEGHVVVFLEIDAPVPSDIEGDAPALFDTADAELVDRGGRPSCVDCRREFALDRPLLEAGASFVVRAAEGRRPIVHARLYRAVAARRGLSPGSFVEVFAELPIVPSEGAVEATISLSMEDIGRVTSTAAAPISARLGRPSRTVWAPATRRACAGSPRPGEVCVPGGAFWFGNPRIRDEVRFAIDRPRLVVLSPFYVDAREVDVASLRASGVATAEDPFRWSGAERPTGVYQDWCTYTDAPDRRDRLPVTCIGFQVAQAHCRARGADLPTEAQWEYVAGALSGRTFPWGEDLPTCGDAIHARGGGAFEPLAGLSSECRAADTPFHPLATDRDELGLDRILLPGGIVGDLAGNVSEHTLDLFQDGTEPCWADPRPRFDPSCEAPGRLGERRTVRGGSFASAAGELAVAQRADWQPSDVAIGLGFRCVRPPSLRDDAGP